MKVVKFGGSSLASSEQLKKVLEIMTSDKGRKIMVVSAPGKRYPDDHKITDLLIACAKEKLKGIKENSFADMIIERFKFIAKSLELSNNFIESIGKNLHLLLRSNQSKPDMYIEAIKAYGENMNAQLIAAYFQSQGIEAHYVNPGKAGLILTGQPGNASVLPESFARLHDLKNHSGILIFPGFFGYDRSGNILTFSRSGSDITGSVLANATKADLYENYTDVDAVYSVNPSIIQNPHAIPELTYREMRELSYAGFTVFHDEALIPAFRAGIPVHIKNTNNPTLEGTKIVHIRQQKNDPVIGIASDNGFCSIYISKYLMNKEIGFTRKLLQILEEFKLSYEHSPSGIDDISIILRQNQLNKEMENEMMDKMIRELHVDEINIERNLALIMLVGEGMRHNIGTAARASNALARYHINIEMINQGSSEVSMMFGVKEEQEKMAVRALYEEFFSKVVISNY